jgi:hypothetical protein
MALTPNYIDYYMLKAYFMHELGEFGEAVAWLNSGLEVINNLKARGTRLRLRSDNLLAAKGFLQMKRGLESEAKESLKRAKHHFS